MLDLDGEWQIAEVAPGDQTMNALVKDLRTEGHIRQVERKWTQNGPRGVYRWEPDSKAAFQHYLETIDTLPCGHRAHVPPEASSDTDQWPCKFCGAEHHREEFERIL